MKLKKPVHYANNNSRFDNAQRKRKIITEEVVIYADARSFGADVVRTGVMFL